MARILFWLVLGSVSSLALGGAALAVAGFPVARAVGFFGHARGHGFGPWHHRHHHDWSEEEIRFGVEWWLHRVDPSEAQVDAVSGIAATALADLRGLREEHAERAEAFGRALAAEPVDRAALEALRGETLRLADQASTRLVAALADAAAALSPEQRAELVAEHERFHRHFAR